MVKVFYDSGNLIPFAVCAHWLFPIGDHQWSVYSFARATIAKSHRLGGLNRKISVPFWRLEVQDQGVSGIGSFRGLRECLF